MRSPFLRAISQAERALRGGANTRSASASLVAVGLGAALAGCVVPAYRFDAAAPEGGDAPVSDGGADVGSSEAGDGPVADGAPDAPPADAALDAPPEAAAEAGPDALDEPALEAGGLDATDAAVADAFDAFSAPDATDVVDVVDATDVVDVLDVVDVPDARDVLDVVDVVDSGPDPTAPVACSRAAEGSCAGVTVATRLSPLAGMSAVTARPVLRWTLPPGAIGSVVRVCTDPRCAVEPPPSLSVRVPAPAGGTVSQFAAPALAPRVYYWSVRALFNAPTEPGRPVYADASDAQPWPLVVRPNRAATASTRSFCQRGFYASPGSARPAALVGSFNAGASQVHRLDVAVGGTTATWTEQPHMASTMATSYGPNATLASGDVNCDGVVDTVIGAPDLDAGRGAVFVLSGATGAVTRVASGAEDGARLGASVAAGGDVNGDGCGDLVAGAPGSSMRRGRVVLVRGGAGMLAADPPTPSPTLPAMSPFVWVSEPDALFGASAAIVGDVDGDGFDDVMVGAPTTGMVGAPGSGGGAVLFIRGTATGLATTAVAVGSTGANGRFGAALRAAGDLNGDGLPDAVIGVPGQRLVIPIGGASSSPFVGFFVTAAGGSPLFYAWTMSSDPFGDVLSGCVDLNGDGRDEVAASTHALAAGGNSFVVALGLSATATGSAFTTLGGIGFASAAFGAALASPGDADGDGLEDLLILDPGPTPGVFLSSGDAMYFSMSSTVALPLPTPTPASFGVAASP